MLSRKRYGSSLAVVPSLRFLPFGLTDVASGAKNGIKNSGAYRDRIEQRATCQKIPLNLDDKSAADHFTGSAYRESKSDEEPYQQNYASN